MILRLSDIQVHSTDIRDVRVKGPQIMIVEFLYGGVQCPIHEIISGLNMEECKALGIFIAINQTPLDHAIKVLALKAKKKGLVDQVKVGYDSVTAVRRDGVWKRIPSKNALKMYLGSLPGDASPARSSGRGSTTGARSHSSTTEDDFFDGMDFGSLLL